MSERRGGRRREEEEKNNVVAVVAIRRRRRRRRWITLTYVPLRRALAKSTVIITYVYDDNIKTTLRAVAGQRANTAAGSQLTGEKRRAHQSQPDTATTAPRLTAADTRHVLNVGDPLVLPPPPTGVPTRALRPYTYVFNPEVR